MSERDVAGAIERVRIEALETGKRPIRIAVGDGEVLLYRALRTTASGQRNDVLRWLYRAKKGDRLFSGSGQLVRVNDEPEYRVVWAGLLKGARGSGLYSEILRAIRSRIGVPLRSDRSMSDAAVSAWEKMVDAGGVSWVQDTERSGYYRINPSHRSRR